MDLGDLAFMSGRGIVLTRGEITSTVALLKV